MHRAGGKQRASGLWYRQVASAKGLGRGRRRVGMPQGMCCRGPTAQDHGLEQCKTWGHRSGRAGREEGNQEKETSAFALSQQGPEKASVSSVCKVACAVAVKRCAKHFRCRCMWLTPQGLLRCQLNAVGCSLLSSAHVHVLGPTGSRGLGEPKVEEALLAGCSRALRRRRQRRRRGRSVHAGLDGFGGSLAAGDAGGVNAGLGKRDLALQAGRKEGVGEAERVAAVRSAVRTRAACHILAPCCQAPHVMPRQQEQSFRFPRPALHSGPSPSPG